MQSSVESFRVWLFRCKIRRIGLIVAGKWTFVRDCGYVRFACLGMDCLRITKTSLQMPYLLSYIRQVQQLNTA